MLVPEPASEEQLAALTTLVEDWLATQLAENPTVQGVERIEGARHWYVRLRGEQKETFGVVFELGQRTLRYDTYLMPAPQEHAGDLYEHLLRRNLKLYGCQLAIGAEDAIYLVGQLDVRAIDEGELDRILGTLYLATEQFFRPAMRIGYASGFR
jgi:Putative bacterial sensory transduction regulator